MQSLSVDCFAAPFHGDRAVAPFGAVLVITELRWRFLTADVSGWPTETHSLVRGVYPMVRVHDAAVAFLGVFVCFPLDLGCLLPEMAPACPVSTQYPMTPFPAIPLCLLVDSCLRCLSSQYYLVGRVYEVAQRSRWNLLVQVGTACVQLGVAWLVVCSTPCD